MHLIFCGLLAKALVLGDPPFPQPDEPANVANSANARKLDKANELATGAILANLPPRYKHLVRDDTLAAGELRSMLKAKLCSVSSSPKDAARSTWMSCIQSAS